MEFEGNFGFSRFLSEETNGEKAIDNPETKKVLNHLPTEEEKKLFGIFISHSNHRTDQRQYLEPLAQAMRKANLYPIYDREFLEDGDEFKEKIRRYLNCYAAVVILSNNSISSDWVNYEIGYFSEEGVPVVLWDPEDILSPEKGDAELVNSHISQYLPAFHRVEDVVEALAQKSIYSNLLQNECAMLKKEEFQKRMSERVKTVIFKLESDCFDANAAVFDDCHIGSLIVNFGMFYDKNGDGLHCYADRNHTALENGNCLYGPQPKHPCAYHNAGSLREDNKECVLLNHVCYNGRFYRKGENNPLWDAERKGDQDEEEKIECGCIIFYLPVHAYFGTEFKLIVDAVSNEQYYKLIAVFEEAGMNPTVSDSLNDRRIYLSLPERPKQGLFRLVHEFNNNFICPYAAINK